MNICAWGHEAKKRIALLSTGGHAVRALHRSHAGQRTVYCAGTGLISPNSFFFFFFKSHRSQSLFGSQTHSPLANSAWHKLDFVMADWE